MKKFSDFLEGRCWSGYKSVPGKKPYSPGSCVKESAAAAAIAAATAIAKKKSGNYDKEGFRKTPYKNPDHPNRKSNTERKAELEEDLRKWFSKTAPEGGWKRINSKGEAIGPCAREPGEPKPKCMSNEKRAKLSKKERASAVRAKRKNDPNPERQGKPINVSNFGKGKISEAMENLDEKNVPTSPEKWAQAKAQAKAKFDVYPSAYANGWASKKYKEMGGGWKSVSEDTEVTEGAVPANEKIITVKHKTSGKTLRISAAAAAKYRMQGYHYHPVNEAKDEQEYGYEGDMALNQLKTLVRCAEMIEEMLKPDTDLPEWVQSKITLATDYIQTAADYMYSEMKEEVEQIDEISDNLAGNYLKKVNDNLIKKVGMKPDLYNHLEPKRQKGATRALNRLMKPVEEGTSADSDGGPPTPAASTLTVTGQPKLTKTVGQTKMIPYVHEEKETKPPFDKPYTTTKAVVKDKSGAKHTPMSRARDLARKAMAKNMKEQSNVTPNPFTVPEIDIGKAPKKTKTTMTESRQLEIVREAMKVAKKKKEVTEAGSDKFIADPELTSQITKSNP